MNNKTILLVEDEALIAMAASMQLKDYGYDVILVSDGQKAIDTINEKKSVIHLILMDIDLGKGIDGTETAKIILENNDIPILFLSSHIEREIVDKTENITSYGYVVKNSSITVLDASIKMSFRLHDSYLNIKNQKIEIESKKKELQISESRYRRLFESAKDGILILDADNGMIVDVNPFLIEMLGYSKEEFLNKNIWDISAFKNIDYSKQLYQELQEKEYVRYLDLPLETAGGNLVHVEFVSNVYLVDSLKVIQCNIRDITDRMRYEKILTTDIDEKEALIGEIQHRVKNSFAMITGLIQIRSNVTQSEETKYILEELALRIKSISDLYSLLYETKSFYAVQLQTYCDKVIESMLNLSDNIMITKSIYEITVSTKTAATIGMIIVELLSNAIKHAFPESRRGIVNIELKTHGSTIMLKIEDNGIGLPDGFDIMKINSVGLHLVNLMVHQLDGTINITSENGTKVIIEYPA
jgi:PAS domain S-box-containing protein